MIVCHVSLLCVMVTAFLDASAHHVLRIYGPCLRLLCSCLRSFGVRAEPIRV